MQNSFDPAEAYDLFASTIDFNAAETLVTYGPGSTELTPLLASAMPTVSADGTVSCATCHQYVEFRGVRHRQFLFCCFTPPLDLAMRSGLLSGHSHRPRYKRIFRLPVPGGFICMIAQATAPTLVFERLPAITSR